MLCGERKATTIIYCFIICSCSNSLQYSDICLGTLEVHPFDSVS